MDILFCQKRLKKLCNNHKSLIRRYGQRRADAIRRRLDELRAASSLWDLRYLPQTRCHELKGNRSGQLSVDLDQPYRLIFRPATHPIPAKADGGLDWNKITAVEIIGIEDTHE